MLAWRRAVDAARQTKTTSCSENQQRNKQSSHKTDQQFHLELLLTGWRVAGWYDDWLADGSGITREDSDERHGLPGGLTARREPRRENASGGLAFVERERHGLRVMLDAASGSRRRRFAS